MLEVSHLLKQYAAGSETLTVLRDISFNLAAGESFSIVGPSGSGKTTLLGLCAGLDRATSGSVSINGICIDTLNENQRAVIRSKNVGFVFQNFQLIPTLTALENVMIPLELQGVRNARTKASEVLERVGLLERLKHYPVQLSGGEQQRVAIARAFVNAPKLLFADEPTGNLDNDTRQVIEDLLFEMNNISGTTLVLVTHDTDLAAKTNRILRLKQGSEVK